jgi:D,D-heptose 1,7-bisphosphate phosphatase
MAAPAVFLDKDGTLVEDVPYNVDPDRVRLLPCVGQSLAELGRHGFRLIVVTNQAGVAHGYYTEVELARARRHLETMLADQGVPLTGFVYCPHHPEAILAEYRRRCRCRKPATGLLRRAARQHGIDLHRSWMIGDILNDVEAGNRAGCRTILLDSGGEHEWRPGKWRTPDWHVHNWPAAVDVILNPPNANAAKGKRHACWTS